jgi:hypothetical protein
MIFCICNVKYHISLCFMFSVMLHYLEILAEIFGNPLCAPGTYARMLSE